MTKAPRFPDPALQAIADEFAEVLRVKLNAEEKLDELFDKIAEELVGYEQRFSDQEIRAITEGIEAMRAMVATRAKPAGGYAGPTAPTGATAAEIPIPPGAISRRDRALRALLDEVDKIAEELVGYEQRFSDQEIRAITEGIEAMRAMVATRAKPAGGYAGPTAPTGATAAEIPIPPGAISRRDRALGALLDEDGQWLRALLDEDRQWLQAPPERRPWWRRIVG